MRCLLRWRILSFCAGSRADISICYSEEIFFEQMRVTSSKLNPPVFKHKEKLTSIPTWTLSRMFSEGATLYAVLKVSSSYRFILAQIKFSPIPLRNIQERQISENISVIKISIVERVTSGCIYIGLFHIIKLWHTWDPN